jgi:predicted nucleic acid-binding protein
LTELADTSAWSWSRRRTYPELRGAFDEALVDGELATCDMVRLELLHSARSATEFAEIRQELAALPDCSIDKDQWNRALWVYEQLSAQGGASQRAVKHPDLLIAAAAEAAGMPCCTTTRTTTASPRPLGSRHAGWRRRAHCADQDQ